MRVVLQRVREASVRIEGKAVASIRQGLLLLVGFRAEDGEVELEWMARKLIDLRIFEDEDGKMNRSLDEVGGALLVVSQFTLYGDARKGRRPSFVRAAPPEIARPLYERFVVQLERLAPGRVQQGVFGAMMEVDLCNDGPVTLVIERGGGTGEGSEGEEEGWS